MSETKKKVLKIIFKIIIVGVIICISMFAALYITLLGNKLNPIIIFMADLIMPLLLVPIIVNKKRKLMIKLYIIYIVVTLLATGINVGIIQYHESLRIKTDINIPLSEYMPFTDNTKIAKLDEESTLKLKRNLPILDGAAATFPLYSAFVNAVYPDSVEFDESPFYYSNTVNGYKKLAEKEIDIFFGAYPSKEQIAYAQENNTEFEYTEIGKEAFVFFVNKDNPVDSLTTEQIRGIYSGEITNWKEVGGKDEEIVAFQRNEGSGSQSMLKRFMGDTPIMTPPQEQVNDFMSGIITTVSDYKNYSNSIGFSFRYYLESIIANPNVKMLKVDGIEPNLENISNENYSITASLYAVTYKGNQNENVKILLDWILLEQGQELVEKTGYARVK